MKPASSSPATVASWIVVALVGTAPHLAADVTVRDGPGLQRAAAAARPGTTIRLAPGDWAGGLHLRGLRGTSRRPIVIAAEPGDRPVVFRGGGTGLQLSDVQHVELRGLRFVGAKANGLNIDDGGSYGTPSRGVVLRDLRVASIGPKGNRDGIKLSGVDEFRIVGCVVERWGDAGQGIDMVGCHDGEITGCTLRFADDRGSGVQAKGGSRRIRIARCRFEHAGSRAVNIGGSTGLRYFRPPLSGRGPFAEAAEITVEECFFTGSEAPIAFVGVDGAIVRRNTIYRPRRYVLRILQETRAEGFVPCRRGRFERNVVVFRSGEIRSAVNVGPATDPGSFSFVGNWWHCEDRADRSRPSLPSRETKGEHGRDPRLRNPEGGDLSLSAGSPAAGRGAPPLPATGQDRSATGRR